MFERASSVVCSRSTSLRREVTWLARVPAPKRAMKSFSCAIFFSRCAFSDSSRDADLRLGDHHVVVAAGVGDDRLVVDVGDVRADRVQEVAVVRDDDQRAVVADEELAQPVDRVEVEVVGRLVEQQRLRLAEERLREQHAHLLAALQLAHRPLVQRVGDVEACEQDRGVALGGVAVLFADDAFELAEAHAVVVGHVGLRVERLALLERRPEPRVAHDHRVDDAELVEGELVLPEDAELVGPGDRALLRRQLAGQQLHEGRLAGAVRPGEAVAAARGEGGGHVLEEHLRAVPHGDAVDCNHGRTLLAGPELAHGTHDYTRFRRRGAGCAGADHRQPRAASAVTLSLRTLSPLQSLPAALPRAHLARRLLLAPGRRDLVAAGVGDELTEMLVEVRHGHDPDAAAGGFLAEDLERRVELRVRHVGQRFLQERERLLELGDGLVAAERLLLPRRGGLVLLRDAGLGGRADAHGRGHEVVVGGDVHEDFAGAAGARPGRATSRPTPGSAFARPTIFFSTSARSL